MRLLKTLIIVLLPLLLLAITITAVSTTANEESGSPDDNLDMMESGVAEAGTGQVQLSRKKRDFGISAVVSIASTAFSVYSFFASKSPTDRGLKDLGAHLRAIDAKLDQINDILVSLSNGVEWLEDVMMFEDDVMRIHFLLDELKRVDLNNTEKLKSFASQVIYAGADSSIQQVLFELHSMVAGGGFLFGKNSVLSVYKRRLQASGQSERWFIEVMSYYTTQLQASAYGLWLLSLEAQGQLDNQTLSEMKDLMQDRFAEQSKVIQSVRDGSSSLFEETQAGPGYTSLPSCVQSINVSTVEAMRSGVPRPLAACRLSTTSLVTIECEAYDLTDFVNGFAPISQNGSFFVQTGTLSNKAADIKGGSLAIVQKIFFKVIRRVPPTIIINCAMNRVPDPENQAVCGAQLILQDNGLSVAIKVCSKDMSTSFWQLPNNAASSCYPGGPTSNTVSDNCAINSNWNRPKNPGWMIGLGLSSVNSNINLRSETRYL